MDKNWNMSNPAFSYNRQFRKSRVSKSGHYESNSSGSSGYVGNQATYPYSMKSGASESNSSGSSGYAGKKSAFHYGHCSKFGHFEINCYENSGYVGEPTDFPHRHTSREMGNQEELEKIWKNSDSGFSFADSNCQSRQSSKSNMADGFSTASSGFVDMPSSSSNYNPKSIHAQNFCGDVRRYVNLPSTSGYGLTSSRADRYCNDNGGFENLPSTSGYSSSNLSSRRRTGDSAFVDMRSFSDYGSKSNLTESNISSCDYVDMQPTSDIRLDTNLADDLLCCNNNLTIDFTSAFNSKAQNTEGYRYVINKSKDIRCDTDSSKYNKNETNVKKMDAKGKNKKKMTLIKSDILQPNIIKNVAESTSETNILTAQQETQAKPADFVEKIRKSLTKATQESAWENMKRKNINKPKIAPTKITDQSQKTDASSSTQPKTQSDEGFSCVVSVHDGVVMHTMLSITACLGFPHDMWIGRSFIDFVHPKDRGVFASQLTTSLTSQTPDTMQNQVSSIVCRIRRFKSIASGFAIKEQPTIYVPFLLKFFFRNVDDNDEQVIYLVIQAIPQISAYKTSNEKMVNPTPFMIRHSANGNIEYVDAEAVPYLGYMPDEMLDKDALQLYHPDDLQYVRGVYETVVREGGLSRSEPYRLLAQNGDYVKLETEWHSFVNLWSKKLEFVVGKNYLVEGPKNPDVFASDTGPSYERREDPRHTAVRENIRTMLNEVLKKPIHKRRQNMTKICDDITFFLHQLSKEVPKVVLKDEPLKKTGFKKQTYNNEYGTVSVGSISPYRNYNENKSSTDTPLSYNKLNYNETLNRYFHSHEPFVFKDINAVLGDIEEKSTEKSLKRSHSPPEEDSSRRGFDHLSARLPSRGASMSNASAKDRSPVRLTASLLSKHNVEMEKQLVNKRRSNININKFKLKPENNPNASIELEQARNAYFANILKGQPTSTTQARGMKRSLSEDNLKSYKQRCLSPRNMTLIPPDKNLFLGMMPLFYFTPITPETENTKFLPTCSDIYPGNATPCVVFGKTIYPLPYLIEQKFEAGCKKNASTIQLPETNFEDSKVSPKPKTVKQYLGGNARLNKANSRAKREREKEIEQGCLSSSSAESWHYRRSRAAMARANRKSHSDAKSEIKSAKSNNSKSNIGMIPEPSRDESKYYHSDSTLFETDEESSISSFYASFLRTDSSAEDTDGKDENSPRNISNKAVKSYGSQHDNEQPETTIKKKPLDPWLEEVVASDHLHLKYQIPVDNMEKTLADDKKRLFNFKQSSIIKKQIDQLYLDLQLQGMTSKLSIDEKNKAAAECSANVNDESNAECRVDSTLSMIYEEDAPLPNPDDSASIDSEPLVTLPPDTPRSEVSPSSPVIPPEP